MKLGLLLFLLTFSAIAGIQELLPLPLKKFELHKTTLKEVEKQLGKAQLNEGSDHYWEKDGLKYAIKLSFDKESKLNAIHFTFTKDKPPISALNIKDTKSLKPMPSSGRSGRFFIHQEKNNQAVIDPLNKSIYSVEIK